MSALSRITMGLVLLGAGSALAEELHSLEVFTTASRPISGVDSIQFPKVSVTVYAVDGIGRFEARLSEGLPADPEAARQEALQRIGQLDAADTVATRHAVMGLARAVQLGVDRVPAIVLDGERVVYGVTDLALALDRLFVESQGSAR